MNNNEPDHSGNHGRFEIQNPITPPNQEVLTEIKVSPLVKFFCWAITFVRIQYKINANVKYDNRQ